MLIDCEEPACLPVFSITCLFMTFENNFLRLFSCDDVSFNYNTTYRNINKDHLKIIGEKMLTVTTKKNYIIFFLACLANLPNVT